MSNIQWIDGGDEGKPLFEKGQTVVTVNPFTMDFAIVDIDGTPLYYVIKDVQYDMEAKTYRYFLDGEDEWFAEDWIDKAPYPAMTTELNEYAGIGKEQHLVRNGDETGLSESEVRLLHAQLDEKAYKFNVDRLLDVMRTGTPAEAEQAKEALKELSVVEKQGGEDAL